MNIDGMVILMVDINKFWEIISFGTNNIHVGSIYKPYNTWYFECMLNPRSSNIPRIMNIENNIYTSDIKIFNNNYRSIVNAISAGVGNVIYLGHKTVFIASTVSCRITLKVDFDTQVQDLLLTFNW